MRVLFCLSLAASLFGALVAGGSYACPRLNARLGLNMSEWLEVQQRLEYERRRSETLARQEQRVWQILEAKFQMVEDVRAGRINLTEAAARFRDLRNPAIDPQGMLFRLLYKGRSDDERWCRQVIGFVRGGSSTQRGLSSVADRLEAELAQDLANGELRLPE
jgi:hypothetical protein